MDTAKVFTNGGSQAIRLPKDCRFSDDEILVNRIGSIVILMPKDDPWHSMMDSIPLFTEDFLKGGIESLPPQERDCL
ncbi:MAG: AbrB/MazE/SpoVT family DNA-binding domain-containing protein [Deltaproteobacteria bacterium]|nr:AbrB/MazE/SpoVT family DNA-binding domain-containing protein [Deltaproteobacteria bacterium]